MLISIIMVQMKVFWIAMIVLEMAESLSGDE